MHLPCLPEVLRDRDCLIPSPSPWQVCVCVRPSVTAPVLAGQELASLLWGCAELAHMGAASLAEEVFVAARSWAAPLGAEVHDPHVQCLAVPAVPHTAVFF